MRNRLIQRLVRRWDSGGVPLTNRAAFSAATFIGSRVGNQDTFRAGSRVPCSPARKRFTRAGVLQWNGTELFCVCDGVGGASRGDAAAKGALMAVDAYLTHADESRPLKELALEAAEAAQRWVCNFYDRIGMYGGCTLAMLAIRENRYVFLNIGDSPGFLVSPDADILELSVRHNLAWQHMRMDQPVRNGEDAQLLRYLGMPGRTAAELADLREGSVHAGYRFLLCSDGITNAFPPETLEAALLQDVTATEIARAATEPEGADNCTLVCLEILEQ